MAADAITGEGKLNPPMVEALEEVNSWLNDAAAATGMAYLEYQEARARFELAEKSLAATAQTARQAEAQRAQILAKFAETLELPPGEWVYHEQKLVRKDKKNAKSP